MQPTLVSQRPILSFTVAFGALALCVPHGFAPAVPVIAVDGPSTMAADVESAMASGLAALRCPKPSRMEYSVDGTMVVNDHDDGRDVRIEWLVRNRSGERVGTVTQQKLIPSDELRDYGWGAQALSAGKAAARGMRRLVCP